MLALRQRLPLQPHAVLCMHVLLMLVPSRSSPAAIAREMACTAKSGAETGIVAPDFTHCGHVQLARHTTQELASNCPVLFTSLLHWFYPWPWHCSGKIVKRKLWCDFARWVIGLKLPAKQRRSQISCKFIIIQFI